MFPTIKMFLVLKLRGFKVANLPLRRYPHYSKYLFALVRTVHLTRKRNKYIRIHTRFFICCSVNRQNQFAETYIHMYVPWREVEGWAGVLQPNFSLVRYFLFSFVSFRDAPIVSASVSVSEFGKKWHKYRYRVSVEILNWVSASVSVNTESIGYRYRKQ